ncbi:uncharacterized protein [Antedon mediterranea]|uniref:uncharacterized protein n=1 Tax=Antedon mediterranea TaxID=105859 RepID=UPI003AF4B90F
MSRVKPTSAPGRITSRDDIWKDIRDWAKPSSGRNDDDDQTLVIGSQIKDNVTEQRMLESRLFDLSKERYKFIVQVAWQRKAFLDRQKQKTGVMKKLLTGIDTTEIELSSTKKQHSGNIKDRLQQYKELVEKTYPRNAKPERDEDSNELLEMKPIFIERIYKTEPVFGDSCGKGHGKPIARYVRSPDKKRGFFPAIGSHGNDAPGRQSVPANFMRREKSFSSVKESNQALDHRCRCSISTPTIRPRYLTYRSVYDGRFKNLQNCLTRPYKADPP